MTTIIFDIINNSMYIIMTYLFSSVFLKKKQQSVYITIMMLVIWIVADNVIVNTLADYSQARVLSTVILHCLFALLLFKSSIVQVISVQIIFVGLSIVLELVVMFGFALIKGTSDLNMIQESYVYFIGGVLSQTLILIIIIIISHVMKKDNFGVLKTKEWLLIMLLPLLTIGIVLSVFYSFNHDITELQVGVLCWVVFGILIMNLSQYYLVRDLARKESSIIESQIITERARTTNLLYDQLAKDRETQKAKDHDTIKLLTTAVSMAKSEGNKELYNYLSESLEVVENSIDVFDCGNPVINALINTKYYEARHNDVPVNYLLEDLSSCVIADPDMVSIIANILDNAIEASLKCDKEQRMIRFKVLHSEGCLRISCENNYVGNLYINEKGIKSDKDADGHGYGLLNIKSTVQKYSGECSIDTDNNLFRIVVIIPISDEMIQFAT